MTKSYLRILDANYNRAKEALRVCEDFARFLLQDKKLTAKFKSCRHGLTQSMLRFPVSFRRLVSVRDSRRDVGRNSWIQDGRGRPGWKDLMVANLRRGQEALRVIEEISKAAAPRHSKAFQRLRFRLYDLEKESFRKI